jgi:hypothetical protein
MFGQLIEEVRRVVEDGNRRDRKARQWRARSAAGGETPSGEYRKMVEPMMKKHGVDIDAVNKARKTGKVTGDAKRSVRQLRKFNTRGDDLAGRAARKKRGQSRLRLGASGGPLPIPGPKPGARR